MENNFYPRKSKFPPPDKPLEVSSLVENKRIEPVLVDAKLRDQRNQYLAIIFIVIVISFLIIKTMKDNSICRGGDTECERYLDDTRYP